MKTWLLIFGIIYGGLLAFLAWRSRQKNTSTQDFILGGAKLGLVIGLLTTAATLFSTFTLQGMPDFFRNHGVGAWIFLAVSDGGLIFCIVWFAYFLRKKAALKDFQGMGGLLRACYENPLAGIVYFVGVMMFLVPYVAIQIRGVGIFLEATFPDALPYWAWGILILGIMLIYSETGGLKAIIFADVLQAVLLLIVVWVIAINCIDQLGGISSMFEQAAASNEALLSTPGPKGLFTPVFLLTSFLAITFIPITQPQISTRLIIMENIKKTHRMAVALGFFAMLVILPTIAIGMYGAIRYADASTAEFLGQALLYDQAGLVAAAAIIGLLAAAISTSDSQIFALGSELRSLLKTPDEGKGLLVTRLFIVGFAVVAYLFSLIKNDQIALLALTSFSGTALLGPMVISGIVSKRKAGVEILWATIVGLVLFVLSLVKLLPLSSGDWRQDWLVILASIALVSLVSALVRRQKVLTTD
jgi:SSS family solute:Na+ symporter